MIQAFAGSTQGDIEKAIDTKFNWWWGGGVATDAIVKAENHGNGDWTATAPCWAAAPNILERPGGLGWSFVLLVLLGLSVYLVLGATRQRVIGSAERWPHADFWREMLALVRSCLPLIPVPPPCSRCTFRNLKVTHFVCAGARWCGVLEVQGQEAPRIACSTSVRWRHSAQWQQSHQ